MTNAAAKLNVIGAGRVGQTLGCLWQSQGVFELGAVVSRQLSHAQAAVALMQGGQAFDMASLPSLPAADVWLLTCPDDELQRLCESLVHYKRLGAGSVVLHCSGALTAQEVLVTAQSLGAHIASVHPIKSFADPKQAVLDFTGTFCIIPSLRGDLVSRPIGEVVKEAEKLVQSGVKELLVVSQDTSAYGVDVKFRTGFVNGRPVKTHMQELVGELAQLGAWVRLHYVYPYPHVDNVIDLMNQAAVNGHGRVLPYLDVPFQHAHPRVLKAMKRPANGEKTLERIAAWRAACPDLTIRSTFIAGFPGETEAEFEYLLDFLDEAQLDRVGCFAYSPVDGAVANEIEGALPEEVREERTARFMEKQQGISTARLAKKVGSVQTVLIDEIDEDGAIARSMADAPEIDGAVYIDYTETLLEVGQFVDVKIHASDEYDLWGALV